ncbi:MAG TPA: hypothetical protein VGM88_28175 [Kofleriaceae bacterium]
MSKVSLRRLLSKLTALALAAAPATASAAPASGERTEPDRRSVGDPDGVDLDADSSIDREDVASSDAAAMIGRSLALALQRMSPMSATHLAATWALSPDGVRRLALAHALEWPFALVGDALVIDHLSRDAATEVRCAAARAAWARRSSGADLGVLDRLADDPDPAVRAIAASSRSAS